MKKIKCELCNKKYRRITNTHLFKEHQITISDYKSLFPESPIDAPGLAEMRVNHLRNKTYLEVYGEDKSKKLINKRKSDAKKQMLDPKQIKIRRQKCGYTHTEEQKNQKSEQRTIHGANNYRKRALEYYGLECSRCGTSSQKESDFVAHHKDLKNIYSELGNHDIENLQVLCKSCHAKLHNELGKTMGKFTGIDNIEKGVHYIFKGLKQKFGLDLSDKNFIDTPKRISRAYYEIFEGIEDTDHQVKEILKTSFPSEFDQLITVKGIRCFSMCPHHLLPVDYKVNIGYIPSKKGQVLGISKLSRLVEILAKRPVLQEQLVEDVTKALLSLKGVVGAACEAHGKHYCMIMRGARQPNAETVTCSLKGVFMDNTHAGTSARNELMTLWSR